MQHCAFFLHFCGAWKGWLIHLGGCLRRCWFDVGSKIAFFWHLGHFGAVLRHVGAKVAIESAKMGQHRRNRVTRAAQEGVMAALKGGVGPLK